MNESSRAFLVTYRPLLATSTGRRAIERLSLQPYVDGSCRREPDLESEFPTITALCRAQNFAPRLRVGDRIAYITKVGRYGTASPSHWRLTALLHVVERFGSHQEAASWYHRHGFNAPRNCVVAGNEPQPLDHTDGILPRSLKARSAKLGPEELIRRWDARYRLRASKFPIVLRCEAQFRNLSNPPKILREDWLAWVGRVPATLTPPEMPENLWRQLSFRASNAV